MLRTIIIDDEEKARENLDDIIKEYCSGVEVVAHAESVQGAIEHIVNYQPDLVFLDIEMKSETGFDLLEKLPEVNFEIIFITAYHEYAVKAFKFSAIDYLLKPINIEELQNAIKRVSQKKARESINERFQLFMENLNPSGNSINKIALPTMDGLVFVKIDEIIQCKSLDNYTEFYQTNGSKILVSKTIKYFEELLSDHNFFRVHRSHLINLDHIKKYLKGEGGYTIMSDGSRVIVSRRKKEAFLKRFNNT